MNGLPKPQTTFRSRIQTSSSDKEVSAMRIQWKQIVVKITFWLIVEIILNLLGLDNLADYSEFVFEGKTLTRNNPMCEVVLAI